jgi:hypothetical protein
MAIVNAIWSTSTVNILANDDYLVNMATSPGDAAGLTSLIRNGIDELHHLLVGQVQR